MSKSLEMVGGLIVEVDVSSVDKAISKLKQLEQSAKASQAVLDGMSRTNLSGLTGQVSNLNRELSALDKTAATAAKSLEGIAGKSLGSLATQISNVNNNFTQTTTTVNTVVQSFTTLASAASVASGGTAGLVLKLLQVGAAMKMVSELTGAVVDMGKSLYDAYQPVQALTMGLNALGKLGAAELSVMRAQASALGVVFSDTAKSQLAWQASIQQTNLEGEKGAKVFNSISGAIRLFGGGTDEVNGSLKALTQMMSKGTVQSEELKGQLGERLPGAFKMMADSLGLSTRELTNALKNGMVESGYAIEKLAELIETRYGAGITNAANTTQAQLNRMKNDWQSIMAGIGKSVDAVVGKVAGWINQWGVLRGIATGFEEKGIADGIRAAAARDGTSTQAKANRMVADANTLLEAKGLGGLVARRIDGREGGQRRIKYEDNATLFARELSEAASKMTQLAAKGGTRSQEYKDLQERVKILQEVANNNKDLVQQAADRRSSESRQRKDAADFADASRASQERQEAIRTNNQRALITLDIEKAKKEIESAAKTMTGAALFEFQNNKREYIAARQAELNKIDNKDARSVEGAGRRTDAVVNRGQNILDSLQEQYLSIDNPLAGKIATIKNRYADLREELEKISNLSTKERNEALARLAEQERDALVQIEKNVRTQEQLKERKKIEQEINDIIKKRESFAIAADNKISQMRFDLRTINERTAERVKTDFVKGTDTSSRTTRERREYLATVAKPYDEQVTKIDKNIVEVEGEMSRLLEQRAKSLGAILDDGGAVIIGEELAKLRELNKSLTEVEKTIIKLKDERWGIVGEGEPGGQKGTRYMAVAKAEDSYNNKLNTTRRLDWGVDKGAQDYVDSIIGKSERARAVMMSLGQTFESVFMSNSWSDAKNATNSFFSSLLKQIQQTIVQLLIVKPLMQKISNLAGESWAGKNDGGGLFGSILRFFGTTLTGAYGSGGSVNTPSSTTSGSPSITEFAANGGAYGSGVKLFANGGVFDSPTAFSYGSNKLGILGEAGPEAILPLKRNSRGALGVQMEGVSNQSQTITIAPVINISGNATREDADIIARQTTEQMRAVVREELMKSNRPGGQNYRK